MPDATPVLVLSLEEARRPKEAEKIMSEHDIPWSDLDRVAGAIQRGLALQAPAELSVAARAARPAAVLVPLFRGADGSAHLIFTERSRDLSRHRGEIAFPGGMQDPGDPSLAATALREANEEIGLDSAHVTILGALSPVFTVVSNFLVVPQVGMVEGTLAEIAPHINPAEVAGIIDAPLAALADSAIYHSEEWSRGGAAHTVHFFAFGPYTIWGATARILVDLLDLVRRSIAPA
jgi:8-oxo-dGTP pyrophosphatase MutT (NUDIX family)